MGELQCCTLNSSRDPEKKLDLSVLVKHSEPWKLWLQTRRKDSCSIVVAKMAELPIGLLTKLSAIPGETLVIMT